ncbi:MAG: alpha-2-macroglobulin, partial [Bacteroidota bacterium]
MKAFNVEKDQSTALSWRIQVPERPGPIVYRVIAKAGDKSDGEENGVPVLTNRMMVTETMPLPIRGNETKQYTFTAMKKASESTTLKNHKLTLEFTSNPAWYAVQALPYLMEYPYECTEQIFSRYYANSLASSVANSHPKIQKVFERWKDTDALESNLSKNQELKTALLEETPWVFQSQNEALQKKRIGLLFDLNKMANEQQSALKTLRDRQLSNGGFSWFPGGRDSWYITQYLTEGFGHLDKLGVQEINTDDRTQQMIQKAVAYIDDRIVEHYDAIKERVKRSGGSMEDDHLSHIALHYLYTRSFFKEIPMKNKRTKEVQDYFIGQSKQYWLKRGYYSQGLMALALSRESEPEAADKIVASLKDRALNSEEMGMYWKYNTGWFWYQAPVETHALMIEVFAEVAKDAQAVDDLKVWMLKNKQTTHWKTTKATANAVYALLMNGDNWLLEDAPIQIKLGNTYIEPIAQQAGEMVGEVDPTRPVMEPGTGYFKTSWSGDQIDPN